ncbi:MAG TPA: hypothetical protein VGE21_05120 [Flavobacteriales bacterium]
MQPGAPILIVSYTFPPYRGIGGRRWMKFAKALAERGHPVHVLHSEGPAELKGSLWTEDLSTPGIQVHPIAQRYPTVLFKRPLQGFGEKVAYRLWSLVLPLLARGNWLDKTIFWRKPFLQVAGDLIVRYGIRDVIVTGAPFRLLAYGAELKKKHHGVRLTSDLRDPWTWHDGYGAGTLSAERKRHEEQLEAAMMIGSDRITSPHPSVVEHLRKRYPQHADKVRLLPHAIDPDELGPPLPARNDGHFRLIYAGSLYGADEAERYFAELLKAFHQLRASDPERYHHVSLDLYITGHGVAQYRERVAAAGLSERIRFHAPLPPKAIFRRIAAADAVLSFIPSFNKDLLGTKFNETFFLRRPLIHVGAPGLVSAHILEHRLGISIPVDRLAEVLPRYLSGRESLPLDTSYDISEHLLARITERAAHDVFP